MGAEHSAFHKGVASRVAEVNLEPHTEGLGHHVHRETLDAADHSNHANSNINNNIMLF